MMKTLPKIDLSYWIMILSANTIGEAGGDLISMTLGLGYSSSTIVLIGLFAAAVVAAVATRSQHPSLYWLVVILSSTAGTTMSDYVTRQLGLGYGYGTLAILLAMGITFGTWQWVAPRSHVDGPLSRPVELLYWLAILISSTLGTAFGDLISNGTRLGFAGGTLVLVGVLAIIVVLTFFTRLPRDLCYWLAIIVTHPLGATMGDYMTKDEGFGLGNLVATLILVAIFGTIVIAKFIGRKWATPDAFVAASN